MGDSELWTNEKCDALFEAADRNSDGLIQYDEFILWLLSSMDTDLPLALMKLPPEGHLAPKPKAAPKARGRSGSPAPKSRSRAGSGAPVSNVRSRAGSGSP